MAKNTKKGIPPPAASRRAYGFEGVFFVGEAAPFDDGDGYYDRFLENLGLSVGLPEDCALLRRYVAAVHVNTQWYNNRLSAERRLQKVFFALSVASLLLVPVFIYLAPALFERIASQLSLSTSGDGGNEIAAQLTASLAGFYAAHRAVSGWLNQRKLIAPYWKARADLMDEIYALETEWQPRTTKKNAQGTLSLDFKIAIGASLLRARQIVREERDTFFTNYTFPDVNLSNALGTAASQAMSTVSSFESPSEKRRRELETALIDRREVLRTKLDRLLTEQAGLAEKRRAIDDDLDILNTRRKEPNVGSDERSLLDAEASLLDTELLETMAAQRINRVELAEVKEKGETRA